MHACRWDMMECGAGFTYDADTNLTGPEAVRFTMQAAASNGLTLVRAFGHGHDAFKSIILQPRPGDTLVSLLMRTCIKRSRPVSSCTNLMRLAAMQVLSASLRQVSCTALPGDGLSCSRHSSP